MALSLKTENAEPKKPGINPVYLSALDKANQALMYPIKIDNLTSIFLGMLFRIFLGNNNVCLSQNYPKCLILFGAEDETRTRTPVRETAPSRPFSTLIFQ